MVNYDLVKEQMQQIDENYAFSTPTWLIMPIKVLGIFTATISIAMYCYCMYKGGRTKPRLYSVVWYKNDMKNNIVKTMLLSSSPPSIPLK